MPSTKGMMGSVHFVSEIWKFGTQNFSLFSDAFEGRCTCFPGQGLLQGHSSKGLMAEVSLGVVGSSRMEQDLASMVNTSTSLALESEID